MLPLNLTGNNLGKRHRLLNDKVKEVLSTKNNFVEIKALPEEGDVDRLFKIDLASKIQDIDYILDTLKSGDELYISKALKCLWVYGDKHADIINSDFLHDNVFPFMSERMVRKTLTMIANNLNSATRAYNFYTYCIENKRNELAKKFLIQTSTEFKLSLVTNKDQNMRYDINTWIHVIGDSFSLAEAYFQCVVEPDSYIFHKFRYLYSLSNTQYLDLFEKYSTKFYSRNVKLGLRMTKDIILKHKDRVLRKPRQYVDFLNLKMLVKHLCVDDIKTILSGLMPTIVESFWSNKYYAEYKLVIKALPVEERFIYIKSIYQEKYPGIEFEMRNDFYHQHLFELMTVQQKEEWALKQLKSNNEVFGNKFNYKWYNFIDFKTSFVELKKLIYKTTDKDQRLEMLTILIKRAKGPNEIESLLTYLFERHINEQSKEQLIEEILKSHNVFEFDETCWNALNKLLHSIEVYNVTISCYSLQKARLRVLLYHILHNKSLPAEVTDAFIFGDIDLLSCWSSFRTLLTESVPPTKHEVVYDILSRTLITKLRQYDNENHPVEIKSIIHLYCNLNNIFNKEDYPDIIIYLAKNYEDLSFILEVKNEKVEKLTQKKLLRLLKTDTSLLDARIPEAVKESEKRIRFDKLYRKLKIYFYNDSAKLWLKSFMENLDNEHGRAIQTAIFSVFQLADESQKKEIMLKYAPTNRKIEHGKIDRRLLYIQEAICRFSMYSRPPVPLDLTMLYLKGDYVHFCLPMFNFYTVSLPYPESTKFIQSLLDAPVSIQKHGIRLVFKHFSFDKQESLVKELWKKSKNVSLRSVMFRSVFNAICDEKIESKQSLILDLLKTLLSDLTEDDDEGVFKIIIFPKLPNNLIGEFLECAYTILHKMPDKSFFWTLKTDILKTIKGNIDHMREAFLDNLVEEFINEMTLIKELRTDVERSYNNVKWKLVVKYIITSRNEVSSSKKLIILKKIIEHIFINWDTLKDDWYVSRKFFEDFLEWLKEEAFHDISCDNNYVTVSPLFELILKEIEYKFSIYDMYVTIWDLKLMISFVNITNTMKSMENEKDKKLQCQELAQFFGKELSTLLMEFIEKEIYFPCMLPEIVFLLENYIDQCVNTLHEYDQSNVFKTFATSTLLDIDNVATCLLALHILPSEIPVDNDVKLEYANLVKKLESSNDGGVKTKYCQMFHNSFKNRFV